MVYNTLDIQQNILKPHGRKHVWCIFLRFKEDVNTITLKERIASYASDMMKSLKEQIEDSKIRNDPDYKKKHGVLYDGGLYKTFLLTGKGYTLLGKKEDLEKLDPLFKDGMQDRTDTLNDDLDTWELDYYYDIHAMIKLVDNNIKNLIIAANTFKDHFSEALVAKYFIEIGERQFFDGKYREHFGYADGTKVEKLLNEKNEPTTFGEGIIDKYNGSYLVFRKLEQNVDLFHEKIELLQQQLGITEKFAGAQIIGKYENGELVSLQDDKGRTDFDFISGADEDKNGYKCPFHAHIRKANSPGMERGKNILRQSIPYGTRQLDWMDRPEKGVGLLFMSYQNNIRAFEIIQENCNKVNNVGIDPLIGQVENTKIKPAYSYKWNKEWGQNNKEEINLMDLKSKKDGIHNKKIVTMKGGEYFYAPSLSYLRNLK